MGVVWVLMRANSVGWLSLEVVSAFVAGTVLATAFVRWELRAREPMVPMHFFRSRAFSSAIVASFLFYASMYGTLFFLPQFLQVAQGYGPFGAGLRLLPWTATLFVFAPIGGNLVNRLGERPLVVAGLGLQAVGLTWIALTATPECTYVSLVAPLILAGAGVSMAMPAAQSAVMGAVAPSEIGKASGTFNMARFLGGVFGVAVQVAVFAAIGGFGSPQAFSAGFVPAIGVAAAMSFLAAIAGAWLPGHRAVALAPASARG
jgi:predicted MFS family arabinose efflux permease